MNALASVLLGLIALIIAFFMAVGHKDFPESMALLVGYLIFDLLLWFLSVGLWLQRMQVSKAQAATDPDAKFYYWLGLILGALLFFVCITFSILLFNPRILKSDTLF